MDEIFESLKIENDDIKKYVIKSLKSKKGPTDSSNWLTNNILIGRKPDNCNEIEKIIKSGVSMFLSLREYDEDYIKCIEKLDSKYKKKEIFSRFNIPDFGTRDASLVKSLVDNIINYVNINNKKIMIHCLGGHGRTGMIVTPLISVLIYLKDIKNKKTIIYFIIVIFFINIFNKI
jgi:protein tyrosine phosphatase